MTSLKIAIIGAGPSGLTLARLLQRSQMSCTVAVYEGEPDRNSRGQGGSLDLHPEGGQLALTEAGLIEEFVELCRPEGECLKLLDYTGKVLWDENTMGVVRPKEFAGRPEIDRTVLRDLLLDSLGPGTVHWGHRVDRVEAQDATRGTHTISFLDGTKEGDFDLVVGADGAFSRVRPLLSFQKPYYSGITMIELWKFNADVENLWLSQQCGAGSCFMFDEGRALMCQRQNGGSLRAYAYLRKPISWSQICEVDWEDHAAVRKMLATEYYGDCGPDIKRMILESDDHLVLRHLWMLPVGFKWQSKAGVTLLGDAAHVATPFAGEGVNNAMTDALSLAKALTKEHLRDSQSLAAAIKAYEEEMFPRTEKSAKRTYEGLQHHFRASGGKEWADRFQAYRDYLASEKGGS